MGLYGQTYHFPKYGYSPEVENSLKKASDNRSGVRGLPKKTLQYPFRPYDIRKEWRDTSHVPESYERYFSVSMQELAGCNETIQSLIDINEEYTMRLVRSPLSNEGLCFVQDSSIQDAGKGLFLRPRQFAIPEGNYQTSKQTKTQTKQRTND